MTQFAICFNYNNDSIKRLNKFLEMGAKVVSFSPALGECRYSFVCILEIDDINKVKDIL